MSGVVILGILILRGDLGDVRGVDLGDDFRGVVDLRLGALAGLGLGLALRDDRIGIVDGRLDGLVALSIRSLHFWRKDRDRDRDFGEDSVLYVRNESRIYY